MTPPPLYHPRPERWPQFTLRGLLIGLTVLGVLLGWTSAQMKWIYDRHKALHYLVERYPIDRSSTAPWRIRMFGEAGRPYLVLKSSATDRDFRYVQSLFPEADLWRPMEIGATPWKPSR